MKKMLKVMALVALVAVMTVAGDAVAGNGGGVFGTAVTKLGELFKNVRTIVYILGAFALIGVAFGAVMGKFKWTTVAVLAVGLALLAVAGQIVSYATTAEGVGSVDFKSTDFDSGAL